MGLKLAGLLPSTGWIKRTKLSAKYPTGNSEKEPAAKMERSAVPWYTTDNQGEEVRVPDLPGIASV